MGSVNPAYGSSFLSVEIKPIFQLMPQLLRESIDQRAVLAITSAW